MSDRFATLRYDGAARWPVRHQAVLIRALNAHGTAGRPTATYTNLASFTGAYAMRCLERARRAEAARPEMSKDALASYDWLEEAITSGYTSGTRPLKEQPEMTGPSRVYYLADGVNLFRDPRMGWVLEQTAGSIDAYALLPATALLLLKGARAVGSGRRY